MLKFAAAAGMFMEYQVVYSPRGRSTAVQRKQSSRLYNASTAFDCRLVVSQQAGSGWFDDGMLIYTVFRASICFLQFGEHVSNAFYVRKVLTDYDFSFWSGVRCCCQLLP